LLTSFTQDIRRALDEKAKKTGRKIRLSARVPSRPETALGLGMDAAAWAREGLIDALVVTPFWATAETDMPIEIWKQLLHGTGVKLSAGIEVLLRSYPESGLRQTNSIETVRGMAWSYLSRGADNIYLFNYYDKLTCMDNNEQYQDLLRQCGELETLNGKTRRHVVTYSDTWAPGEPAGYLLPAKLSKDDWKAFRLHTGAAPKSEKAYVLLGVKEETGAAPEIYLNGKKCGPAEQFIPSPPLPEGPLFAYPIGRETLHDGHNLVEATGSDCTVLWVEIYITEGIYYAKL